MGPDDSSSTDTSSIIDSNADGASGNRSSTRKKCNPKVQKSENSQSGTNKQKLRRKKTNEPPSDEPQKACHPSEEVLSSPNADSSFHEDKAKKMISDLMGNNRDLAKRLEQSEIAKAEQEKQLQYFLGTINHVRSVNTKVQEAMVKMNSLATHLNDVVCTLVEVRDFAKKAMGDQEHEEEHTLTMTLRVPVTGLDDILKENTRIEEPGTNRMEMSAINEDASLSLFECSSSSSIPNGVREDELDLSWIGINDEVDIEQAMQRLSNDMPTSPRKSNNRRKSGLVVSSNKTPPLAEQHQLTTISGSETPKTPVLSSVASKAEFKSNIPKALQKNKETTTTTIGKNTMSESNVIVCNGSKKEPHAKKRGFSKKADSSTGSALIEQVSEVSHGEECHEVVAKKAKLSGVSARKSRQDGTPSQVSTRRRTIILSSNSDKPVEMQEEVDIAANNLCENIDASSPKDRRKTYTRRKKSNRSPSQPIDPTSQSTSDTVNDRRLTFCVQRNEASGDLVTDGTADEINEKSKKESQVVNETCETLVNETVSNHTGLTKDSSDKDSVGVKSDFISGDVNCVVNLDMTESAPLPNSYGSNVLPVGSSSEDIVPDSAGVDQPTGRVAPEQVLNSTVHNVEDMELTEVLRAPVKLMPILADNCDNNEKDGAQNKVKESVCESEETIVADGVVPAIAIPEAALDVEKCMDSTYKQDSSCNNAILAEGGGCHLQNSHNVVGGKSATEPNVFKNPDSRDLEAQISNQPNPENSNFLRSETVADDGKKSDSVKEFPNYSASPLTGKPRGTLYLVKTSPMSSTPSSGKKTVVPPAGSNDPCCSKSLPQIVPVSGLRVRKKNTRYHDYESSLNATNSDEEDSDFNPGVGYKKQKKSGRLSIQSQAKSAKKGKTPSSTANKLSNNKARQSTKGRAHSSSNLLTYFKKRSSIAQDSKESVDVLDVYDVRNMDELDSNPKFSVLDSASNVKKVARPRGRPRKSVSKTAAPGKQKEVRVPSDGNDSEDDGSEITIVGEVKGTVRRRYSKTSRQTHRLSKRTSKREKGIEPVEKHGKDDGSEEEEGGENIFNDSKDDFSTCKKSRNPNEARTKKKRSQPEAIVHVSDKIEEDDRSEAREDTAIEEAVDDDDESLEDSRCLLSDAEIADLASEEKQPFIQLPDAFRPIKNSSNSELVRSGLKVQVQSSESNDVLRFTDKLNDSSIIELNLPDSIPKQRRSHSAEQPVKILNKRGSDKENNDADWPDTKDSPSQKPSVQPSDSASTSTAGSRRVRKMSYKEPNLHSKLRRPK